MKKNTRGVAPEALISRARMAGKRSYSPYSRFWVGAALLCNDGSIFTGANIENASSGLTVCAERVAVHAALSAGVKKGFAALAVAGDQRGVIPCGACLQVLSEFAENLAIYYIQKNGKVAKTDLRSMLPMKFSYKVKI